MPRPKDDRGLPLPAAHERLPNTKELTQAAYVAICGGNSAHLSAARKIQMAKQAIDHVFDGAAVPKNIYAKDKNDPQNKIMAGLWRLATDAIYREKAK